MSGYFDRAFNHIEKGISGENIGIPIPYEHLRKHLPNIQRSTYYLLGANSKVSLEIIDLNGKIVKEGYRGYQPAGYHTYKWSGMNQKDEIMPSGIYIYKVEVNGYLQIRKMVLMK